MPYAHLRLERETPQTQRHPRRFFGGSPPENPRAHGATLAAKLAEVRDRATEEDIGGFDNRKLLKISLREGGKVLPPLDAIQGIEIVSQEGESLVLAFATDEGLSEFESRLTSLARDGTVTRKELLFAIGDFDHWTAADRTGAALREQGFPMRAEFVLDIELWPQERQDRRQSLLTSFFTWLQEQGIEKLDDVRQPSLLMARIRCSRRQADLVLKHRDVRTVDLPPRLGIAIELLHTDINQFPPPPPPPSNAPPIAVLDSGLTSGHPLLGTAVGDAHGYLPPGRTPEDGAPHWHGTFVGGLALHGHVEDSIRQGRFVPQLRLFSGRVFHDDGTDETRFVEKAVEESVRDLNTQYGCKVFNLSYGDHNKIYDGRHVRGLAYTLDRLARELGVLFVVPTGNLLLAELPTNPTEAYPNYLLAEEARLLDPAPALNVLTVGGISRHESTRDAQRNPLAIEDRPVARANHPFPLTRRGPSINGAIKPDVVEHAGNLAVMRAGGRTRHAGLGVVSLHGGFAAGPAFREDIGTSYAAPVVAHRAARLLGELPEASHNLLRVLIAAHARWPAAAEQILAGSASAEQRNRLLQLLGYGRVDDAALFRSLDDTVTLIAEERIGNDQHHFYELPLPSSFWAGGRRTREITVTMAYCPQVRTTRLDYRMSKLWFSLVTEVDLDAVTRAFTRNRLEGISERSTGRWLPNDTRKNGTLQSSRWTFKQALTGNQRVFVVITRQDTPWASDQDEGEPYALAAVLADREPANARLYAEVQALLTARIQLRQRARA